MDQTDDAPGDQVLAIGAAAAWIDSAARHGPRELEVRDDALISTNDRLGDALPRGGDRRYPSRSCQ